MVIDTSAVIAIFSDGPEADLLETKIADDPTRLMSAATMVESAIVIEARWGEAAADRFDLWLEKAGVQIVAVELDQVDAATRAWRRFGRGRHPAGLDFGDCFALALALVTGEKLLYRGEDFEHTGVESA